MGKAELKTMATDVRVEDFIAALPDERRREDARVVDAVYRRVTQHKPRMWGPSIVGYGSYDYRYPSGRTGTMCKAGFSPRKAALTLYLAGDWGERRDDGEQLFARLGPHTTGKACLYIKRLDRIDLEVLEQLVALAWERMDRNLADQIAAFRMSGN